MATRDAQLAHSLVSRGRTRRLIERVSEDNAINFKQRRSFPVSLRESEREESEKKGGKKKEGKDAADTHEASRTVVTCA